MKTPDVPPNWYADPAGRFEVRYWDGWQWTEHVAARGMTTIDPLASPTVSGKVAREAITAEARPKRRVQRQIARAGASTDGSTGEGGNLFTEPILVVNQKPKLVEVHAEYAVFNQQGHQVGAVREVGRSLLNKVVSSRPSASRTTRLQVLDAGGQVVLTLVRPAKLLKSVIVRDRGGIEAGQIVQKTLGFIGGVRFDLVVGGASIGSLSADGWDTWDFSIKDAAGREVGRVTKGRSLTGLQTSTKRDKYVVEIAEPTEEPLRTLAVASALAIDTALHQK